MSFPVFHIGFPKSGSTFLQHQVFPALDNYAYMGVHAAVDNKELYDLLNRFHINLFKSDSFNFDISKCVKDKNEILNISEEKPLLFSYEYGVSVLFAYPDAIAKAERLAKVFGKNLKIVMIVREQIAILSSQYRDHPFEPHDIHRGKPVSFEEWYKQTNKLRYFRFTDLVHYERLIRVYDDLFGKENVLVLPMELMSYNADLYAQRMGEFLRVDSNLILQNLKKPPLNVGHSAGANRLRRIRRRIPIPLEFSKILPACIYKAMVRVITKGGQDKVVISKNLKEEIRQRYASSNKCLEDRIDVSLEPLGYSVEEENSGDLMTAKSSYGKYAGYKNDRYLG